MQVARTREELRAVLAGRDGPVGFVPTMGWLHEGHISLVERARGECATVVLSIFVNPRQFGDTADYDAYPRDEGRDLAIAAAAGVDVAFVPSAAAMYPPGHATTVAVRDVSEPLEGAARPGHFDGVTTVVALLLGLVGADRAYFGLKDYQQVAVVRRMTADLGLAVTVVACPTVREADGLARSSRNVRLSPAGRAAAAVLHRALQAGVDLVTSGEGRADGVRDAMRAVLATEPLAAPEYLSAADPDTLHELDEIGDAGAVLSLAAWVDGVRLIDNELAGAARRTG